MYCKVCGAKNRSSDRFCSKCGSELKSKKESDTQSFAPAFEEKEPLVGIEPQKEAVLVVAKGPVVGQRFLLDKSEVTLGRDPASDIFLDDITVSRKHAKIEINLPEVTLMDVGSLNGTYVNSVRIEKTNLKNSDELQVGKFKLIYLAPQE